MDDHSAITPTSVSWRRSQGLVAYPDAIRIMRDTVTAIREADAPQSVWLLEHPPTFTAGTSARPEDLFNHQGFETFAAGRGGQWTYHGPGQRVAYVMLDLLARHGVVPPRDVRAYVRALEDWLIAALARLGVEAGRRDGRVGVWVRDPRSGRDDKIAALGVRVTRWVCWHGVSVNVAPALNHFDGIVPCGLREHGVTSLSALGNAADMVEVDAALAACWPAFFGGATPSIRAD